MHVRIGCCVSVRFFKGTTFDLVSTSIELTHHDIGCKAVLPESGQRYL